MGSQKRDYGGGAAVATSEECEWVPVMFTGEIIASWEVTKRVSREDDEDDFDDDNDDDVDDDDDIFPDDDDSLDDDDDDDSE